MPPEGSRPPAGVPDPTARRPAPDGIAGGRAAVSRRRGFRLVVAGVQPATTWRSAPPTSPARRNAHESFMTWLCPAQAAIADPETFTPAMTCHRPPVATTSQAGRRFAEALDTAVRMTGILNRELRDRNEPETSRWCASLTSRAPLGELTCGPIGRAPKMAGKKAGVSGTDTKLRPRPADVAEQAGVSPATASRVLTGSARVRLETRREVEEAIARLGYMRNRAPRSSVPRRTGSIGFVVCEDNSRVFTEPFFPLMLRSMSRNFPLAEFSLPCSWRTPRAITR